MPSFGQITYSLIDDSLSADDPGMRQFVRDEEYFHDRSVQLPYQIHKLFGGEFLQSPPSGLYFFVNPPADFLKRRMGFSGPHDDLVLPGLCNTNLPVFVIEADAQQTNDTGLIFTVHGFSSIPFLHKTEFSGLFHTLLPDGVMVAQQTLNLLV